MTGFVGLGAAVAVPFSLVVGTATTRVVCAAVPPGAHCTHALGPGAPEVQPGTIWVVRSVGASGETVTVNADVLVAPGVPQPESRAEQVIF